MRYGKRSWTAIDALVPQIHVALNVALAVRLEGNKSLTGDFRSRITETVFRAHIAYRRSENTVCHPHAKDLQRKRFYNSCTFTVGLHYNAVVLSGCKQNAAAIRQHASNPRAGKNATTKPERKAKAQSNQYGDMEE